MISGIYQLNFGDALYYVGKSNDIARRWKEHDSKFKKGTAAKSLQNAYFEYGIPEYRVLLECHSDHIDLMEGIFIRNSWGADLLNTTKPSIISEEDLDTLTLTSSKELLRVSTAEHIRRIREYEKLRIKRQLASLKELEYDGELPTRLEDLEYDNALLNQTISDLRNRSLIDRILNV